MVFHYIYTGKTSDYENRTHSLVVRRFGSHERFLRPLLRRGAGEKYTNEKKGFSSYFLSFGADSTRLELMHSIHTDHSARNDGLRKGPAHFAFSAGSRRAVDELTSLLENDGFSVMSHPRTTGDGYYESAVEDPEGNAVEITV